MSENSKRSVYVRFDKEVYDQLQQMSQDSGESITELVRNLVERALKADPAHVRTWQYYGLWQVEQGNRDQAQYHLNRIAQLAGTNSDEYRSLAAALEKPPGTGLVY